jgi:CheY-like chemotaxis protein
MKEQRIVYMIDDDIEDQEIFLEILGEIDVSIKCLNFFNGSDALDQLLSKGTILPDFIFIDLNMPVMNGYEFLKEVKTHTQLTDLPE